MPFALPFARMTQTFLTASQDRLYAAYGINLSLDGYAR
jgi:hypothetical protein